MKKFFQLLLLVILGCWRMDGLAQSATAAVPQEAVARPAPDAERTRISAERAQIEAASAIESSACYQTFFVNNCLDKSKVRQMDALSILRRQEIVLNENERERKAADQLSKINEKASPEKQRADVEKRQAALREFESRAERASQKSDNLTVVPTGQEPGIDAANQRAANSQASAVKRAEKQAAGADNARKYKERQEKAEERRARFEQEQLKRKSPVKPLPVLN